MTTISCPYAGAADLSLLIDFARNATLSRAPGLTYLQPGDVVWQFYRSGDDGDTQLWLDDAGLVAFAAFEPPLVMQFELRPGLPLDGPLGEEVLAWVEARCRGHEQQGDVPIAYSMLGERTVSTEVLESDQERVAFLEGRGYQRVERHQLRFRQRLNRSLPPLELPPGMRVRHVTDADIEERMDLHRDAWSVWGPSPTTDQAYRLLRTQPEYDATLDLVLEDGDGRFLSYCICWADAATGTAVFEPVGTRPAHAGKGYARLVIGEGLRRVQERGLHTALVGTASVNTRATALYPACGFELVERQYSYSKAL